MLLLDQSYIYEDIRRAIGGNWFKGGISKFFGRYKETQSLQNKTGKGRKICKSTDDLIIERLSLCDRRKSSGNIQEEMAQRNVNASAKSVRRRLKEFGLNARIQRKKTLLSLTHRLKR